MDLQFISTSATAEFLGSTGSPTTIYMSKNTANKTFYYKDSGEGNFTITVNARGRDTGIELSVSQQITVSANASENTGLDSSGEVLGASTSSSSSIISSGGGDSTTNVSSPNAQLEILAGSDRLTSPGSPIWFQGVVKKNTVSNSHFEFSWSFGDGNVGVGSLVSHTYKYPGDYVVVLSARAGDIFSVSRLKVKVAESDMGVIDQGKYLEISNNGNTEINLFNWKIENGGKGFIFQPNTIILPHSSIKLDKSLLKMKGLDNSLGTCLKNSLGEEVFVAVPVKAVDFSEVSKSLDNIKKEALAIQDKIINKIQNENQIAEVISTIPISSQPEDFSQLATSTQDIQNKENVIYEAPKSEGFISKLTNFIKRVFSK
jgi:hypothetical protein